MWRRKAVACAICILAAPTAIAADNDPTTVREVLGVINERDIRYTQRFNDQEKAVSAALAAAKEAVIKAEAASEKRFDAVNEFRGQLKDQAATLISRSEALARFASIEDSLKKLEAKQTLENGRSEGVSWITGIIFAFLGATGTLALGGVAVLGFVLRRKDGQPDV